MRRLLRALPALIAVVVLVAGLAVPGVAPAHPMSRDKYSLRTAVQLAGGKLDAVVVLEVPFDVVTGAVRADMEKARTAPDPTVAAQAVLDAYTKRHWDALARGLTLTIDGQRVAGAWKPSPNRLNGKGAVTGGFFMYIVEFVPSASLPLDGDVTVVVDDQGYTGVPMVYSAMVVASDGWKVASSSATALLPDRPYDLNAPDFWVEDPALRKVAARFLRAP